MEDPQKRRLSDAEKEKALRLLRFMDSWQFIFLFSFFGATIMTLVEGYHISWIPKLTVIFTIMIGIAHLFAKWQVRRSMKSRKTETKPGEHPKGADGRDDGSRPGG